MSGRKDHLQCSDPHNRQTFNGDVLDVDDDDDVLGEDGYSKIPKYSDHDILTMIWTEKEKKHSDQWPRFTTSL